MQQLLLIGALLLAITSNAQDYVDILSLSYANGFNANYEDNSGSTSVNNFDAALTYPFVIDESNAIITGLNFNLTSLELGAMAASTKLYSTTLTLGWAKTWNERWSSTVVFLPKVASDYNNIGSDDYYFGGFAVAKFQKKENLLYRFGLYASTEAFGIIATPIIGLYYISPNDLWEIDLSLPISANINKIVGRNLKVGADYVGLGRSYSLTVNDVKATYVQQNSLEFSAYLEKAFIEQSLLLRVKAGVSTNDYELYAIDQEIDLALSAFRFGDERTRLNETISTAPFLRIEAIYRFYIEDSNPE